MTAIVTRLEPREAERPQTFYAAYDTPLQEIAQVFETQRQCAAFCDEHNSWLAYERYVVEPVPAAEWADDEVRWDA